jgi:hypothetical protein
MGAKEKAERHEWDKRIRDAGGPDTSGWIWPDLSESERLLDAYDDAEEAGDFVKMLEITKIVSKRLDLE